MHMWLGHIWSWDIIWVKMWLMVMDIGLVNDQLSIDFMVVMTFTY
jgi:hypothetical protein